MYAIVDVAGQQFKVEKDQKIFVHRLEGKEGDVVNFDRVLLIEDGDKILIGEPVIQGAIVSGKILNHLKGDKVNVFKKKRRKGYQVLTGHRQYMSQILIEEILEKGEAKKETGKKVTAKAKPKTAAKKEPAPVKKSTAKTSPKEQPKAKTAVKKPAAKAGATAKKTTTKKAPPKKGSDTKKKSE